MPYACQNANNESVAQTSILISSRQRACRSGRDCHPAIQRFIGDHLNNDSILCHRTLACLPSGCFLKTICTLQYGRLVSQLIGIDGLTIYASKPFRPAISSEASTRRWRLWWGLGQVLHLPWSLRNHSCQHVVSINSCGHSLGLFWLPDHSTYQIVNLSWMDSINGSAVMVFNLQTVIFCFYFTGLVLPPAVRL